MNENVDSYEYNKKMAELEFLNENYRKAKKYYENIIRIKPADYQSQIAIADCYFKMKEFKKSEEILQSLLQVNSYNNYVRERLFYVNEEIIKELEEKCQKDNENKKYKFKLAWYYFNNFRYDEVISLCDTFEPGKRDRNQYLYLLARTYIAKKNYWQSLKYINEWEEDLKNDYYIKDEDKIGQLNLLYFEKIVALSNMNESEQALDYCNKALRLNRSNTAVISNKAKILNKLMRYEESLKVVNDGLRFNESSISLHINKAESLYNLKQYEEAEEESDMIIGNYPYHFKPYLLKIKIYDMNSDYDNVLKTVKEAEKYNAANEEINNYKLQALKNINI